MDTVYVLEGAKADPELVRGWGATPAYHTLSIHATRAGAQKRMLEEAAANLQYAKYQSIGSEVTLSDKRKNSITVRVDGSSVVYLRVMEQSLLP